MRALVVHNRYRSGMPSGENRIVDAEVEALLDAGVEVETYMRSSDEIAAMGWTEKALLPARPLRSPSDLDAVDAAIRRFRPHVLHLHNPYPLISPAVVDVALARDVPVVHTVHNYRQVCARGTFFRDGHVCEDCRGTRYPWPAVLHGCYRDSRLQSTVMATALTLHRDRWRSRVALFLAVSEFGAEHLVRFGVPADRIRVKPNPVADPGPPTEPGRGFLFAGRLEEVKGVDLLLHAWSLARTTWPLLIAGDGPAMPRVRAAAERLDHVEVLGLVPADRMRELYRTARVVVVPSICYEGYPTAVIEAFAHGRPVLASDLGSMARIVTGDEGWRAEPVAEAWARALERAERADLASAGRAARSRYEQGGFDRVGEYLVDVYEEVVRSGVGPGHPLGS